MLWHKDGEGEGGKGVVCEVWEGVGVRVGRCGCEGEDGEESTNQVH